MKVEQNKLELNPSTNMIVYGLMGLGVLSFFAGIFMSPEKAWFAFLLNNFLFLGLGIGSLFFLVVHYLASAGWNVAVRRITESVTSYVFIGSVTTILILAGLSKIYPWMNLEHMMHDHILRGKIGYFSPIFFAGRVILFLAMVCFFAWKMLQNSIQQDQDGGVELWNRQKPLAALFLVIFSPYFVLFSVDMLKSLDPHWFSTMFGVYVFIGFVQSAVAAVIIVICMLQRQGHLKLITADHFHDLGKYLFGFSIFWAYIGVSQYLLIWYANLPEETTYYLAREKPGWLWVDMLVPAMRFILPFLLLLPRMAKRTPAYLEKVALIVFIGAWFDLNLLVMPTLSPSGFTFSVWDIGMFLGFLGFFSFAVRRFLSKNATIPVKDPFLHETLHHHVM